MKQHYDDICDYIKHNSQICNHRYYTYSLLNADWRLKMTSDDDKLVIRACINDIPPLKSKLEYKNILDFRVHIMLLKFQNELLEVDAELNDAIIYGWIKIRRINILNRMNQIRVNNNYKEPFDI